MSNNKKVTCKKYNKLNERHNDSTNHKVIKE